MKDCVCGHAAAGHISPTICLDCDCEGYVSATKVGVPRMWDERSGRADRQWAAQAVWASLDSPRRSAVLLAVGERLSLLLGCLDDWVPQSVTLRPSEGGPHEAQSVEVSFTVVMPTMTDREADDLTEAERARLAVVAELADFARQLRTP